MSGDEEISRLGELVREHLLPLLKEALDAAAERHLLAADRGSDSFSFGTDAWSLPARLFKQHAEDDSFPFKVRGPGCVLFHGDCTIRHHKVGVSENDDIARCFPGNARAAAASAGQQLRLFEPEELTPAGDLVLAYMANPESGLCAVYLARVGAVEEQKIVEWSAFVEIWKKAPAAASDTTAATRVPAEDTSEPVVELIKKSNEKSRG
ncbi:MAG TPA: hypothetical protein VGF45_19090 [Polyangia bacterium]